MILKTSLSFLTIFLPLSGDPPQLILTSPSHLHNKKTLLVETTSMDTEAGIPNKQVILVSVKKI